MEEGDVVPYLETPAGAVRPAGSTPPPGPRDPGGQRAGAWLLVLAPLGFAVGVAGSVPIVLGVLPDAPLLSSLPPERLEAFGPLWWLFSAMRLSGLVGMVGVLVLARRLRRFGGDAARRSAGWASTLALAGVVVWSAGVVLIGLAGSTTSRTLGDDARFATGNVLAGSLAVACAATAALCVALRRARVLGRSAVVLGVLSACYGVLDVVSYPLNLAVPPILGALVVWFPLGVVLLRAERGRRGSS